MCHKTNQNQTKPNPTPGKCGPGSYGYEEVHPLPKASGLEPHLFFLLTHS